MERRCRYFYFACHFHPQTNSSSLGNTGLPTRDDYKHNYENRQLNDLVIKALSQIWGEKDKRFVSHMTLGKKKTNKSYGKPRENEEGFRLMKESDYTSAGKPHLELKLQPAKHETQIISKNWNYSNENSSFWTERQPARTTTNSCACRMRKNTQKHLVQLERAAILTLQQESTGARSGAARARLLPTPALGTLPPPVNAAETNTRQREPRKGLCEHRPPQSQGV